MQEGITEIPRWTPPQGELRRPLTSTPSAFLSAAASSSSSSSKPIGSPMHLDLSSPGNSSRDVTSFSAGSSEPSTPEGEDFALLSTYGICFFFVSFSVHLFFFFLFFYFLLSFIILFPSFFMRLFFCHFFVTCTMTTVYFLGGFPNYLVPSLSLFVFVFFFPSSLIFSSCLPFHCLFFVLFLYFFHCFFLRVV